MSFEGAVLPQYGGGALTDLLPSIGAHLGLDSIDHFSLPVARSYLVVLVDGLGWRQLNEFAVQAEFLGRQLPTSRSITCSVPSTTATSLTSLGTGSAPGQHGLVGYRFLNPASGGIMNALSWEGGPERVTEFQQQPTIYERLAGRSHMVGLARFAGSGLTAAAMRGTELIAVEDESDHDLRVEQAVAATSQAGLVYLYERMLDHTGHAHGVGSWQWLDMLAAIDDLIHDLREALPDDVCVIVTGDHGMVNVSSDHYLVIEDVPGLGGYDQLAGEARFRHLYTSQPEKLANKFRKVLGERAWVATKSEAIEAGLFGAVLPSVSPRLGDVVVAMRDNWVLMTRAHEIEMQLVGVHGSLTAEEMLVPLIVLGGS